MIDRRFQVSPCDGLTNNALVEESCRFTEGGVVPSGTNYERWGFPEYEVLPSSEEARGHTT